MWNQRLFHICDYNQNQLYLLQPLYAFYCLSAWFLEWLQLNISVSFLKNSISWTAGPDWLKFSVRDLKTIGQWFRSISVWYVVRDSGQKAFSGEFVHIYKMMVRTEQKNRLNFVHFSEPVALPNLLLHWITKS